MTHNDNRLIADLYQCINSPAHWITLLDQIKARLGVISVVIQVFNRRLANSDAMIWSMRDSKSMAEAKMHDHWVNNSENPRFDLAFTSSVQVLTDDQVFAADCRRYQRFQQRLARAGLGRGIMLDVAVADGLYVSMIAHQPAHSHYEYTSNAESFLYWLAPHLSQVIQLQDHFWKLQQQNYLLAQSLNFLRTAALIVDAQAQLIWCNAAAEYCIARSDTLARRGQKLIFHQQHNHQLFRSNLSEALTLGGGLRYLMTLTGADGDVELLLAPLASNWPLDTDFMYPKGPRALLYFNGARSISLDAADIQQLFGLTATEARIAVALAEGRTLADYAKDGQVTIGTARIQLKSIFSKLNISRQAQLVQKLCSSVCAQTLSTRCISQKGYDSRQD